MTLRSSTFHSKAYSPSGKSASPRSGVITLAKLLYISAEMTAYVEGEVEKKNAGEAYDEDAFDPETGEPLTFR